MEFLLVGCWVVSDILDGMGWFSVFGFDEW